MSGVMAASFGQAVPGLGSLCMLDDPLEGVCGIDFLDMQEPFLSSSSCEETTAWMCELWESPCEPEGSALDEASSFLAGTTFDFDRSSADTREEQSANDATCSSPDSAATFEKVGLASVCRSGVISASDGGKAPALQLDCDAVLRAWQQRGGAVQETCGAAAPASVSLQLPAPGASDAALIAAFGSYGDASLTLCSASNSAPTSPSGRSGKGRVSMFVPVALGPHKEERGASAAPDAACSGNRLSPLMPLIPNHSSGMCWGPSELGSTTQTVATTAARTADAKTARAACALRCKQKKSGRQVVKVRYEMRKLNAEQRPRYKGRFVKRETDAPAEPVEVETLASASSIASEFSDMTWLL